VNAEERSRALTERRVPAEERTARIWTASKFVDFTVYTVPTELLVLNPENRRFRAEAQEVVGELRHPLKAEVDEPSIIALLLDKDPRVEGDRVVGSASKDTRALIEDWNRRRQEQPLWVRPDGMVSNGNRRLAMLKRLQLAHGDDGYDHVDVVFMSEEEYDEEILFEMEAREQLTEGLKVRYTKMNGLLTLRDAAEKRGIDWNDPESIRQVAERIRHLANNNSAYAKVQLQAVKYMTDYLIWRGMPGNFAALREMVERFRDLGKNMDWVAANDTGREAAMLQICFVAIAAGVKHGELRAIRHIAKGDIELFDRLVAEIEALEAEPDDDEEPIVLAPGPIEDDDDDEEDEEAENVRPRSAKQGRIAQTVRGAANAWAAHDDPPEARVRAAAGELAGVDPAEALRSTAGVTRDGVERAMAEVITWAAEAEKALADAAETGA
jgi:hypothetical protein